MDINNSINDYIVKHSSAEDPILAELSRETHLKVLNPRMLSGHIQGIALEFISRMIQPKAILEIGTYTGYSAICLAKGLAKNGKLITIESNEELANYPDKYFFKSGFKKAIQLILGDACEIIPKLESTFDLVFIDADKKEYIQYYNLVIEKVRAGGFILADNVLWSGKVLTKPSENDLETISIQDFNNHILMDNRVENLILPLRDGINIIRKK